MEKLGGEFFTRGQKELTGTKSYFYCNFYIDGTQDLKKESEKPQFKNLGNIKKSFKSCL